MSSRMLSSTLSNVVSVLLEGEKDDMRRWLRTEMDQFVDPFIDRLFDKLGIKLTSALARSELADCGDQMMMNPTPINLETPNVQVHQSSALNYAQPQPDEIINPTTNFNQPFTQSTQFINSQSNLICHASTSTSHLDSFDPTLSSHQVQHNASYDQEGQTNVQVDVKEEFDESSYEYSENQDTLHNEHVNGDIYNYDEAHNSAQTQIKEEVDESNNEQLIETDQTQYLSSSLPIAHQNYTSNPNLASQTEYENYDWDSDECVDGIDVKDEFEDSDDDNDDDESDELIELFEVEQNDEESSSPVKKSQIDPTQQQHRQPQATQTRHNDQTSNEYDNDDIDNDPHNSAQTQFNEEIDESTGDQLIPTDQTQYSLSLSTTNQNHSNTNVANQTEYENYDWDSDECANGIEITEQFDDDDDSDALSEPIEMDQNCEEFLQPAKRARLDPLQQQHGHSQDTSHSLRHPNRKQINQETRILVDHDDEDGNEEYSRSGRISRKELNERPQTSQQFVGQNGDQMETQPIKGNNHDKHYITLSLQCLLPECPQVFVQNEANQALDQLDHHLLTQHSIGPFRCALKDCGQTVDNKLLLCKHVNQIHRHITEWQCDKCPKLYNSYTLLSSHTYRLHHLGQFQCTFPGCTFIGDYREKVHSHYYSTHVRSQHKVELICSQTGCGRRFTKVAILKIHQRTHQGFVPYRCTWSNCGQVFLSRAFTISHIRRAHLNRNMYPNLSEDDFNDPKDYYEVAQDLITSGQHHPQLEDKLEAQPIEVNNHDKAYITLSVRCVQPECRTVFVQNETNQAVDQLKHHLQTEHSIGLYRCALKNCGQTFDNQQLLDEHIKQNHRHITNWQCGKCLNHYSSYLLLSHHNRTRHHLGQFQCSFSKCTFIGDCQDVVHSHYSAHFRQRGQLVCSQFGCGRRFTNARILKIHQRTHKGMVPYRCTWPNCAYLDSSRPKTILHIRTVHLKPNMHPNLSESIFNDPKDYYEVAQDLM